MKQTPIKVMLIEDNPGDVSLVKNMLEEFDEITLDTADTLEKGVASVEKGKYNAILLDLSLPDSKGVSTLVSILIKFPEHPVIVLTGYDESELGVLAVQAGAQDYFSKQHLSGNLIARGLHYAIERQKMVVQLRQNAREIERLRGLLPICMNCKKIRNDKGYWEQVEQYISDRSSVTFSHGLCPDCFAKLSKVAETIAGSRRSKA